jgi:hypothetical protein
MSLVTEQSILAGILEMEATPLKDDGLPRIPNSKTPYVAFTVDSEKTPSPIETLHTTETSLPGRFPLAEYYALGKGKGRLSYHNNPIFEQPYVIKDIGNRWGLDDLQPSKFVHPIVAKVINFAAGTLNDVGGAVLGREPNEYIGSAIGSYERTGKFLLTSKGIGFLTKQAVLQRRNAHKIRTDVRYDLTKNLKKKIEDPRLYNPLSLGSLPGVTKISINSYNPTLPIALYLDSIASFVSKTVLALATTVKETAVRVLSGVATGIANAIAGKVTETFPNLEEKAKEVKTKAEAFQTVLGIQDGALSKLTGIKIDNKAFADVGKDRVNLIPYGETEYKGKSYKDLDFVPFKFYDVHNKKSIVFRAIVSAITDTFTPEYAEQRYIGRPDNVYVYIGTTREISFTFDIYPKSDEELIHLWEKMNYLAGLTYPSWTKATGGGQGMIAPFCKLTLGQMYADTSGYISGLTYTVMDEGTWETTFAKLPKYIQASCTFVYIGDRLPSTTQKHYEIPWVGEEKYRQSMLDIFGIDPDKMSAEAANTILGAIGMDGSSKPSTGGGGPAA